MASSEMVPGVWPHSPSTSWRISSVIDVQRWPDSTWSTAWRTISVPTGDAVGGKPISARTTWNSSSTSFSRSDASRCVSRRSRFAIRPELTRFSAASSDTCGDTRGTAEPAPRCSSMLDAISHARSRSRPGSPPTPASACENSSALAR